MNDPNNYDAKNAKGDSKAKDNDKAKKEPTTLWSAEMNTFIGTGSMRYYIKGDKACDISYGALLNKHDEACKECSFVYELSLAKLKAAKDGDHCKDGKGASGKSYFFGHGKDSGVATLYEKKDQKWQKIAGYSYFDAKSGLWYIGFGYGAKSTKETKKK